jgi:hypothetical protein
MMLKPPRSHASPALFRGDAAAMFKLLVHVGYVTSAELTWPASFNADWAASAEGTFNYVMARFLCGVMCA